MKETIQSITRKVKRISKREKATISICLNYNVDRVQMTVSSYDKLSQRGQRLIEKQLHVKTEINQDFSKQGILTKNGRRTDKDGNEFILWFHYAAVCKKIGTRKETRTTKRVIKPEVSEYVKEEVNVPIYKCPEGVTLE